MSSRWQIIRGDGTRGPLVTLQPRVTASRPMPKHTHKQNKPHLPHSDASVVLEIQALRNQKCLFKKCLNKKLNQPLRNQGGITPKGTCAYPLMYNFTDWNGLDKRMPLPWCKPRTRPPLVRSLKSLAAGQQNGEAHNSGNIAVVPSLIVPCCAHSGTTFLWRCMRYAFHPSVVCGEKSTTSSHNPAYAETSSEWTSSACAEKKYLLPGLTGNIQGHWDYRKEWFFYGGGASQWSKGWQDYMGVSLPLCYWEASPASIHRCSPPSALPPAATELCGHRHLCKRRGQASLLVTGVHTHHKHASFTHACFVCRRSSSACCASSHSTTHSRSRVAYASREEAAIGTVREGMRAGEGG